MKKIELTEDEVKEAIRLYTVELLGSPAIGKILGYGKRIINRTLKENGVEMGPSGRKNTGGKSAANKRYSEKNKEHLDEYYKEWAKENREHLRNKHTQWRDKNREHVKKYGRDYERERRANDPVYRLVARTRTALCTCLKEANVVKYCSTFDTLGYSLEELMVHLEKQFTEGMTWDNYGEWHVDHIIPISSFEFESVDDEGFKNCWALSNLQPLWAKDNLSKGSKIL